MMSELRSQVAGSEVATLANDARPRRVGVVLFQLGGPDSLEAVRPFLYNLFCDPDIIDLPLGGVLRKPLAWWIAKRRWEHARHGYEDLGGRSPLLKLTERQAAALHGKLRETNDAPEPRIEPHVIIAMRYWHPLTAEAVRQLDKLAVDEIVLLPLYPQYSLTTTGSSVNEWNRQAGPLKRKGIPVRLVNDFYAHPMFVDALVENINVSLEHFAKRNGDATSDVHLVFSAHGLPMSFIERGDPYQMQVEETARLVMSRGGWSNPHTVCYQSKVGRQRWLEPSLIETIDRLAAAGTRRMLVIPVAFVSEHIETLHEVNVEARERALKRRVEQFAMMPALGDSPKFIEALADLVRKAIG